MHSVDHQSAQSNAETFGPAAARNFSLLWTHATGGPVVTEPVVVQGAVYVGSWDGREYALNATNGTLRWSTYLGQSRCSPTTYIQGITSTAAVANGMVYVGGGGDYWDALSASTGSVAWKIYTGNSSPRAGGGHYNWASPLLVGNSAYIGLASFCDRPLVVGGLLKVNLLTHVIVGRFNATTTSDLGASIWASPAYDAATGVVYAGTGNLKTGTNQTLDDSILAVDANTMRLVGHFHVPYALRQVDGDFGASPTLYTSSRGVPMVAEANKDGYLFGVRATSLAAGTVWQLPIATHATFSSAAFSGGVLYVGSGRTVDGSGHAIPGALRAINGTTGRALWNLTLPGVAYGPIAESGGVVAVAAGTQLILARAADGTVLYRYTASGLFQGGPTIAGGEVFVGNDNGEVLAFGIPLTATFTESNGGASHLLSWKFDAHALGGAGGYQYAWRFGDGVTSTSAAPYHTYAHSGTYTVRLVVNDQAWSSVLTQTNITVRAPGCARTNRRR